MEKKQELDIKILAKVLRLAKPYSRLFWFCLILATISAPISSVRPYLINRMVDDYIKVYDIEGLKFMVLIFVGVVLINVFLRYNFIYFSAKLGQSVVRDLRVKVFDHVQGLRLRYFDQTPIGRITTRTISDIQTINDVFTQGFLNLVADVLAIIAVLGFMFFTSWRLTIISILTMPLMVLATYIFKEKVKVAFKKVRDEVSHMNAFLQEQISGMQIVQLFNAEKQQANKFKNINRKYTSANLDAIEYYAIFFPVVDFIYSIGLALLIWWGAQWIWGEVISIGAFIVFPMYLNMLFRPIRMLADKFNTLQMGLVGSARVFNLLEDNSVIPDEPKMTNVKVKGNVSFRNVWFAYDEKNFVLRDISFSLEEGQTMAIVGSTGSGKSTIINILNRFYDIQKGQILIDGEQIQNYGLKELRSNIAMVLQDVFLFTGTVMENITLRDGSISKEDVIAASKKIGAHDFIIKLPEGYDFKITQRGSNLSMGQRQLISFVRALVVNPRILILDEATSSIDSETESIIQYAIEKLIEKRTSIIIAHRLSTIRHADNILVLDNGELVENGTHQELLQIDGGIYQELHEKQFEMA